MLTETLSAPTADRLELLPPDALVKTGEVDHADWNFRPILGTIQRMRFKLIRGLLAGRRYHRILEIGYGSGVLMPELKKHCDELYGIDVHEHQDEVEQALSSHGVTASLQSGSAADMPYGTGMFEAVVIVSALEFIEDLDQACQEISRVLVPGGTLLVVTPGHSALIDFGLKILTGESAKNDFGNRREAIIPCLLRYFQVEQRIDSPRFVQRAIRLYTGLRLTRTGECSDH